MSTACTCCNSPKGALSCGICQNVLCKKCAQLIGEETFAFLEQVPDELKHPAYCPPCFTEKVAPEIASYKRLLARARKVIVYIKGQGEETRLMKRKEKPIRVLNCTDRDETLLRLAVRASNTGFNALLDVHITAKKVRKHGYQTLDWTGMGIPTNLELKKIESDEKTRGW